MVGRGSPSLLRLPGASLPACQARRKALPPRFLSRSPLGLLVRHKLRQLSLHALHEPRVLLRRRQQQPAVGDRPAGRRGARGPAGFSQHRAVSLEETPACPTGMLGSVLAGSPPGPPVQRGSQRNHLCRSKAPAWWAGSSMPNASASCWRRPSMRHTATEQRTSALFVPHLPEQAYGGQAGASPRETQRPPAQAGPSPPASHSRGGTSCPSATA